MYGEGNAEHSGAGLSGTLGKDFVVRQMRDGTTIVSAKPNFSHRKFSKGQLSHQSRFQEVVAYARSAAKTNPLCAELARGTMKNAYNIALSDWFTPPMIHGVTRQGSLTRVETSDNVRVAKVVMWVLDEEGKVVEQGEGIKKLENTWECVLNAQDRVVVEAWDLAGNVTSQE